MEIKVPNTKMIKTANPNFFDLMTSLPTCSPIGVIAISEPNVNNPIPKTKKIEHKKNLMTS